MRQFAARTVIWSIRDWIVYLTAPAGRTSEMWSKGPAFPGGEQASAPPEEVVVVGILSVVSMVLSAVGVGLGLAAFILAHGGRRLR